MKLGGPRAGAVRNAYTPRTRSEYDNSAVISNIETNEKLPLASDLLWTVVSFIDPAYTLTVPARQTVAGSCDIMSHFMEQYFMKDISPVAEGLIEGILRTVIRNTPVVLENPADLDARSELLWASTLSCNGILHGTVLHEGHLARGRRSH